MADINPEPTPVLEAIKINARALQIMNERINNLPHEQVLERYYHHGAEPGRSGDGCRGKLRKEHIGVSGAKIRTAAMGVAKPFVRGPAM